MKKNVIKLSTLLLMCGLGLTGLDAQEAIPATGGNATGSGGSVSYSLGQIAYTTSSGLGGSVARGVQQPYVISVVDGVDEPDGISLNYLIFPNPTTDFVQLKVENFQSEILSYRLYDLNGKLLENKKINESETRINMRTLANSTYFLKIIERNIEIITYKIIKN